MVVLVYLLCALTSAACAALLLRGYHASGTPLLKWSGLCFAGFAANNLLLVVDRRLVPETDLSVWVTGPTLLGIGFLLFGLIWEAG